MIVQARLLSNGKRGFLEDR